MAEERSAQQVREITDKLEQGIKELFESERFKEYLRTMSKFYNYSFSNTLLIAMQKPDATLIAGYTAWQKNFQRQVSKGERGIKILAPAPYKSKVEQDRLDPATQKPVLDKDGNPLKDTVEVVRPAFKVVSVFDVSQTYGNELPDITVDELTGNVENFPAFFSALESISPVPIAFEDIPGGAKGYYHLEDRKIAIQEGMGEIQTVKTAIHEIAHAKLHAIDPDKKLTQEERKDNRTREVEAESVAYTVCQRYGIETSDYSFGYVAGWSSGKETKELKGSLETIRATAAEMIESIDGKLKEFLKEKNVEIEQTAKPVSSFSDVPIYREVANYAFEAGELDAYRASHEANVACKVAIENAIADNYRDNRLGSNAAKDVLEQFGADRVLYVLANTVQHKDWDGRISKDNKEWAKIIDVCPEKSDYFIVDKAQTGLMDLFLTQTRKAVNTDTHEQPECVYKLHSNPRSTSIENRSFIQQYDRNNGELIPGRVLYVGEPDRCRELIEKLTSHEITAESLAELGVIDNPQVISIEKTVVEVHSPVVAQPENKSHKLTSVEKDIKAAVMDKLKAQIAVSNDGINATYRASLQSQKTLAEHKVRIDKDTVLQNGEPLFHVQRRFASRKTQGCYRELTPTLEYMKPEKERKAEKPSIREQLRAAKAMPDQKAKPKSKGKDMER